MKRNDEKMHADGRFKDLPGRTENLAFAPDQLVDCPSCRRQNPPTRTDCVYCAAALPFNEKQKNLEKFDLRKLENWEKGFSLIVTNCRAETDFAKIGELLGTEAEIIRIICETRQNLPLVRLAAEREAMILSEKINLLGAETVIVSDQNLQAETPTRRLRGISFNDQKITLKLFNTGENIEINADALRLIVTGAIFERKVEAIEKRGKKEVKILESTETDSTEPLVDLYAENDEIGYRILTKGFDFSGLGKEKGILAVENIKKLTIKLREIAPHALFADQYLRLRELLGEVWEIENHRDSKGMKRHGFSKFDSANVESSSNLQQFTKYSRLCQRLYEQK